MTEKLKIVLTRSLIGRPDDQRDTARVLGLTKIHHSVLQEDTPAIRGYDPQSGTSRQCRRAERIVGRGGASDEVA